MTLTEFLLARIAEDEESAFLSLSDDSTLGTWSHWVNAECEAKRRIVERYANLLKHGDSGDARWVLPFLALPYSEHPDYDEEWKP